MIEPCLCGCESFVIDGSEIDMERICTLASNLAIAAGLERMYQLGALTGYWSCSCDEPQDPDWINPTWHPNAKGWAATDRVDHWTGNPIDGPNTDGKEAP